MEQDCACKTARTAEPMPDLRQPANRRSWNIRYFLLIGLFVMLWWSVYCYTLPAAKWLSYRLLGLAPDSHLGGSVEFFFYDSVKILLLLLAMIYMIGWLRAAINTERIRAYLLGKGHGVGYFLGSGFGAITPFCSCSSVPLFLGFTSAGIPIGITMAFLITSPLVNEIAVVLLWGLVGWQFTVLYITVGMLAGILGGWFMDSIGAGRWLQPFILESLARDPVMEQTDIESKRQKLSVRQRHDFACNETKMIFTRVWKWVFIGVGIGAVLHGFVPQDWFARNLGAGQWWTVPVAVVIGIPLYSNVTGIIPVMQSLLIKGMPIGTTLAFCMSSVAASIPEFLLLRQVMTIRLQAVFIIYLWLIFILVGWLLNAVGPYLR